MSNFQSVLATLGSLVMGAATLVGIIKGLANQARNTQLSNQLSDELLRKINDLQNRPSAALLESEVKQQQYLDGQQQLLDVTQRLNHKQHELANALQQINVLKSEIEERSHGEHVETRREIDV